MWSLIRVRPLLVTTFAVLLALPTLATDPDQRTGVPVDFSADGWTQVEDSQPVYPSIVPPLATSPSWTVLG